MKRCLEKVHGTMSLVWYTCLAIVVDVESPDQRGGTGQSEESSGAWGRL